MHRHKTLAITAPESHWKALGYQVYTDGTAGFYGEGAEELLVLGLDATGAHDERVIAWALAERQRRREERDRTAAAAAEAQAIAKLADAIRSDGDEAVLQRILSRLTERTQHAVRQQLRHQ